MEDRETQRMHKYGESKTTRIMMATVRHMTFSLVLRKFQTPWFFLNRLYLSNKKGDKKYCSNFRDLSFLSTTYKIWFNIMLSRLTPHARRLLGIISVDFDATGQLILYSGFVKYLRKNWNPMEQCISYFLTSRNLMLQLGRRSCIVVYWVWYPHTTGKGNKNVSEWNL